MGLMGNVVQLWFGITLNENDVACSEGKAVYICYNVTYCKGTLKAEEIESMCSLIQQTQQDVIQNQSQ